MDLAEGDTCASLADGIPSAGGKLNGVLSRLKCFLGLSRVPKAVRR
jgi:hypothetical protein